MILAVAVCDTKQTGISWLKHTSPIASFHLFWSSLECVVSSTCLGIAVSSVVVLVLQSAKQIVFAQVYIQLIGDDSSLGLGYILIGKHIAHECPRWIMSLLLHHDLNHWHTLAILIATRLILERICATQGVVQFAKLTVQLGCKRCKTELSDIAARERRHAIVGIATIRVLISTIYNRGAIATNASRCRCRVRLLAI